jgi:hypothetical protein
MSGSVCDPPRIPDSTAADIAAINQNRFAGGRNKQDRISAFTTTYNVQRLPWFVLCQGQSCKGGESQ